MERDRDADEAAPGGGDLSFSLIDALANREKPLVGMTNFKGDYITIELINILYKK